MGVDPRDGPVLSEEELAEALVEGAALFDAGRFWEAHEAWETAWHRAPGPDRDLFRGLIHAAAACLHHERGNAYGYARQRERMIKRLDPYPVTHRGVAVRRLVEAVEGLPPPGTRGRYPKLDLARR